jgi:hypothetical protein
VAAVAAGAVAEVAVDAVDAPSRQGIAFLPIEALIHLCFKRAVDARGVPWLHTRGMISPDS